ncbi:MAG: hypothetical protein RIT03_1367 [Bacteroidota bacterium]|jgi:hexosaminidase
MQKYLSVLWLFTVSFLAAQPNHAVIPAPHQTQFQSKTFTHKGPLFIKAAANSFEAQFLAEALHAQLGMDASITQSKKAAPAIILTLDSAKFPEQERYQLAITPRQINIHAGSNQGLFYGVQTLLQLMPIQKTSHLQLACVTIEDQPKYAWRGMHLDVARHFFPTSFIKKYIDYLATYKFNTFHWHLTDDQGWRIEIKKYPKLTEQAAWRNGSMVGHYRDQKFDSIRYGGFYTQDDIKEIVAYAAQRHITVVPEIEMPGHAQAALSAYPEFSCTGGPFEVAKVWGVLDDVYCPKEETFTFLTDILSEVIELFPSTYIHLGGDECPKTRWKNCSNCQQRIQALQLKDEHELQSYFVQRMEKFVNSKGRKIIGWDETLEGGLAPNAAVMSWRGTEGGIAAAKQNHFVVMTPGDYCYFDHYQLDPATQPLAIGGFTSLEKVYSFNPTPAELTPQEAPYILGAQANVWTEYIATEEQVEYMIFPRLMALSEVLWGTAKPLQYPEFAQRVAAHFARLDQKGVRYCKSITN